MRNPRRLLLIIALVAVTTAMALGCVLLDVSLGRPIEVNTADPVSATSGDLLIDTCPYLPRDNTHPRRAETTVDVSIADNRVTVVKIRWVLTTSASDPLLECVREADRTEFSSFPDTLARRFIAHASVTSDRGSRGRTTNEPVIDAPLAEQRARITLDTELRFELSDVVLSFERIRSADEANLLVPNRITVHGDQYLINKIVGAGVLRQTPDEVEVAEQVDDRRIDVGLSVPRSLLPDLPPAWSTEPLPSSSNGSDDLGSFEFPLLMLLPWAVVLIVSRRSTDPLRLIILRILTWLLVAFIGVLMLGVIRVAAWDKRSIDWEIGRSANQLGLLVLLVGLPLMVLMLWRRAGEPALSLIRQTMVLLGVIGVAGAALALLIVAGFRPSISGLPVTLLISAGGAGLFAMIDRRPLNWLRGLTFGMACAAGVLMLRWQGEIPWPRVLLGLVLMLWMVLAYRLIATRTSIVRQLLGYLAAAAVGLSLAPLSELLSGPSAGTFTTHLIIEHLFVVLWLLGNLALGVVAIVRFRQRGADPSVVADPLDRGLACAAVLVALQAPFDGIAWAAGSLVVAVGFSWLLRGQDPAKSKRLARVSSIAHTRLVRLEGRRQAALYMAKTHFRSTGDAIVNGDKTMADVARTQSTLDTVAGLGRSPDPSVVRLPQAALGSGAGAIPWRNALASALCAAVLSALFAGYEALLLLDTTDPKHTMTVIWLGQLAWWSRWVLVGLVFGYFYPAIRGSTPMRKAGLLIVVLLPLELVTGASTVLETGIRVGYVVMFCLSLGLFWEWRLAHAAGFNWGRVRNFGKIRSLVLPATTVLVGVATALAQKWLGPG